MRTEWWEYRLELDTTAGLAEQTIYLSEEDYKQIWSPQIIIGSNIVSGKRNGVEFGFRKEYEKEYPYKNVATMKFYLGTTVICDMDFQEFPFDKHFCEIEVSNYFLFFFSVF